jgi:hypothetical protein
MPTKEITVQTPQESLQYLEREIPKASQRINLISPQIGITPNDTIENSPLLRVLDAIKKAKENPEIDVRIITDLEYMRRITRIKNRNVPNHYFHPFLTQGERALRKLNAASTNNLLNELIKDDLIQNLQPRIQSSEHSTGIRTLPSLHLLHKISIDHEKIVVINDSFIITTANLTTSDYGENADNNIAILFEDEFGKEAANFIYDIMLPDANLGNAGGLILEPKGEWRSLIFDINNVGDPGRLPFIYQAAEKMIMPSRNPIIKDKYISGRKLTPKEPETVVLLTQYVPSGKLVVVLKEVAKEAKVIIPRQPKGDYREEKFPYNLQAKISNINKARGILRPYREKSSHIKCLMVKYKDGTAAVLVGSDDFSTYIQKFVRNRDACVLMEIKDGSKKQITFWDDLRSFLLQTGEINEETYSRLDLSARDGT